MLNNVYCITLVWSSCLAPPPTAQPIHSFLLTAQGGESLSQGGHPGYLPDPAPCSGALLLDPFPLGRIWHQAWAALPGLHSRVILLINKPEQLPFSQGLSVGVSMGRDLCAPGPNPSFFLGSVCPLFRPSSPAWSLAWGPPSHQCAVLRGPLSARGSET